MSHDWAWSEGSRDIEIEANRDAMPDVDEYICAGCGGYYNFDADPPLEEDDYRQELWGIEHGTIFTCPRCVTAAVKNGTVIR